VTITIALNPSAPPLTQAESLATAHAFGPEGQQFLVPIQVTLGFENLPPGVPESAIVVYAAPQGSSDYQPLPTTVADSSHVTAQTTHFSNHCPAAPYGDAGPADGGDSGTDAAGCPAASNIQNPSAKACVSQNCCAQLTACFSDPACGSSAICFQSNCPGTVTQQEAQQCAAECAPDASAGGASEFNAVFTCFDDDCIGDGGASDAGSTDASTGGESGDAGILDATSGEAAGDAGVATDGSTDTGEAGTVSDGSASDANLGDGSGSDGGSGGGSDSGFDGNVSSLEGTYSWTASETDTCTSGTSVSPLTGTVTEVAGPSPGEVTSQTSNGCDLNWTVSGSTLTLAGTQTCTVPAFGGTWVATFTQGTTTLNATGSTYTESGNGTLTLDGAVIACTFVQTGTTSR
jgi:hypothetical protein